MSLNAPIEPGAIFGKWEVQYRVQNSKDGKRRYLCLCTCGNSSEVVGSDLLKDKSTQCRSCAVKKELGSASWNDLYGNYTRNAKNRGRVFELAFTDFRILCQGNCAYCGVVPSLFWGKARYNGRILYNGIDRVDNSSGYILSNVVTCCSICNKAKGDLSDTTWQEWIKRLVAFNTKG